MTDEQLSELHKKSFKGRESLKGQKYMSCFHCLRCSLVSKIKEWADGGQTAICPRCGIDSCLPGVVDEAILEEMEKKYFGMMKYPRSKK